MLITHAFIIAMIVLSIWYTMQEGEIFGSLGNWFAKHLHPKIHPAVFECNVCMTPWYGSAIYLWFVPISWDWPVTILTAMGMQIVINKWSPKD